MDGERIEIKQEENKQWNIYFDQLKKIHIIITEEEDLLV